MLVVVYVVTQLNLQEKQNLKQNRRSEKEENKNLNEIIRSIFKLVKFNEGFDNFIRLLKRLVDGNGTIMGSRRPNGHMDLYA